MFLAVDIGNSQTTLGLYDAAGAFLGEGRLETRRDDGAGALLPELSAFLSEKNLEPSELADAAVASVVPSLALAWNECLSGVLGFAPVLVGAENNGGIEIAIPYPEQAGADRIANAVAAKASYGAPAIVVDFGTATNIDVVDEKGAFRGGTIAPGVMTSANALFERAARLSSIPVEAPPRALGDTTQTAVQSGLVIGAAAAAEGIVARIKAELGIEDAPVIATGGLARTVSAATELFDAIDPDLTLRGIREIGRAARA